MNSAEGIVGSKWNSTQDKVQKKIIFPIYMYVCPIKKKESSQYIANNIHLPRKMFDDPRLIAAKIVIWLNSRKNAYMFLGKSSILIFLQTTRIT